MIITVEEAKEYLRIDHTDEDTLITTLIETAEEFLFNATGKNFTSDNKIAALIVKLLVNTWYENRELIGSVKVDTVIPINSLIVQLKWCD